VDAAVPPQRGAGKHPFDIDLAIERLREAIRPLPQAALFALAADGFDTPFELLMACIISIRTRDEVTLPCARRLFALARTPLAVSQLTSAALDHAISPCTFHDTKAMQIREIARSLSAAHGGTLPCDAELLRSFRGVGPKCTHLVLGIGCHQPCIGVDVHVHRITNRWGYVQGRTPVHTMTALEAVLPQQYWIEINRLLVPFGKHICTRDLPRCSTCPLFDMCQQVGVKTHR
jgi:endonuclease-3